MNLQYFPLHFYDHPIEVIFTHPPARRKTPPCPDGFIWDECTYTVIEKIAEWVDFSRRGRKARNMRPTHAVVASHRGSLGVGRFYFRVQVSPAKHQPKSREPESRVFDIYYDREIKSSNDRSGHWFLYSELSTESPA